MGGPRCGIAALDIPRCSEAVFTLMAQSFAVANTSPGDGHDARSGRYHGGALLADLLAEHGVAYVFGVPGGQTLALYDGMAAHAPAMRHVLVRDERTAAYAADAYARISGRPGVCDATVGPGTAKLPSGLAEALGASVPVVALVSDLPSAATAHRYRGAASQALDQAALLAPVTKWVGTVPDAAALPALVRLAFREATTGRPGPTALILPQDVLDGPAPPWRAGGGDRFGVFPAVRSGPDPSDAAAVAAVVGSAARPFVLAGGGALHAGAEAQVRRLAERLSAAVATTLSGKGVIAEDHPLAVGVSGAMGTTAASQAFDEADVVLLVGAKASGGSTYNWTKPRLDQQVVQIDVDPVELGRAFPVTAAVCGDARVCLEAVLAALDDVPDADRSPWAARVASLADEWRAGRDAERASDAVPIAPQRVVAELEGALGADDIVVCDASLSSGWGCVYLEQRQSGRRILAPRGAAGLGYALPAAIGAAIATAGQRTVVIAGDGAMGYALGELPTVSEHELPVTVVVLNNRSLGWIRWYRRITFGTGWEDEDFGDVPFADVARAIGWHAERVTDPEHLGGALRAALEAKGPSLVDVVTETWQTPLAGHRRAVHDQSATAGYGG